MSFTKEEQQFFRIVVETELKELKEQGRGVFITEDKPVFLAAEEKYEEFLENLLNKL